MSVEQGAVPRETLSSNILRYGVSLQSLKKYGNNVTTVHIRVSLVTLGMVVTDIWHWIVNSQSYRTQLKCKVPKTTQLSGVFNVKFFDGQYRDIGG